ncbi:MAG: hypothetical protein A3C85_01845 [Candidatus Doudnabacteria bacterium RIFCSPHIGHO2_02_FULL_48_21]|uniref:Uncharacterized protein n=1 Tax=Candidatus Doudnabacteria bacterium RIFCSPLOWO2_02_FULL_48_13 TaxID=1817845 RepID=A0A1F5QAY5_9BACT|nr:MAG: hypothetical protein A3K05_02050 [Candidatus Doudnabacteria bacterium RIFCSPHIGHO2_01_48_18]OGE78044.1 MAG: hypothetical protein A2668_03675 [Candidatus Doudnabacteria bacterium RIFCSPHIGHO2_01_FULL_48_180]OGE91357.1 MAG: hypothetical protein A3F44_03600 [Candidatus Doudnabacteria bacterium RIFCSPHIGHO2_12_FULL_47_25]OGE93169.1 MAG: hypothetical protein A3C85_01845 [Candidatus Doudnabacteria bacterium RIFCSPHIGHO2_02_FULL_48_21]OGE96690.1 MAG: hypothetical protein A3A83_02720 [Candidatu
MAGKIDKLSDNDIDKIANLLDDRLALLATKEFVREEIGGVRSEMKTLENNLKTYIDEGIETVMEGIDNLSKQLAEKERVDKIAKWAKEVGEKVGVRIDI